MSRPALEVADIVRSHLDALIVTRGGRLSAPEHRALHALLACRTAALGGHVLRCDHCAHELIAYNSCRNRHCPKCQAAAREAWLQARQLDLLPVPYFHIVFTLPHELSRLALHNQARLYDLLFRSAAAALLQLAADPRHLGARIGLLAVLHTWGQTLQLHPHVHCVVPGGGIAPDGTRWVACSRRFFLPVRALSRLFRGKFLAALKATQRQQPLVLPDDLRALADPNEFTAYLRPLYRKEWVVYAKPPFGGPAHVLRYLARYTHRVAIANSRLLALRDGQVTFRYKDYAHGSHQRSMTLAAGEFLRRFLLHVLPGHFVRIRHYGFLANRCRQEQLATCRRLLGCTAPAQPPTVNDAPRTARPCPQCKVGVLIEILGLVPDRTLRAPPPAHDTS